MKTKSPQMRAAEYANKPYVKRILGNDWSPDSDLLAELEDFWTKYLRDNIGRDVPHMPYTKVSNMILGGIRHGFYERYQRLESLREHTLEHYQTLFGDDLGQVKYQSRSKVLSKSNSINDIDDAVDAFFRLKQVSAVLSKDSISDDQLAELRALLTAHSRNTFRHSWSLIADIVKYHYPDYVSRFNICKTCNYNSDEYLMARYGNDESKVFEIKLQRQAGAPDNFSNTPRYWTARGFDQEAAIIAAQSVQQNRAIKAGNKMRGIPKGPRTVDYWIKKGHTAAEASDIVSKWQRRDRDWFTTLYGLDDGNARYTRMIDRRKDTWYSRSPDDRQRCNATKGKTRDQLVSIHGEQRALDIIKRRTSGNSKISRESIQFFIELDQLLGDVSTRSITGYKGTERFVKSGTTITWVDYYLDGKIIEFHGSYWHADPRLFESTQIHSVINTPCGDIWLRDQQRIDMLEKLGYNVLVIWSKDVDDDKQRELEKAKRFLLG